MEIPKISVATLKKDLRHALPLAAAIAAISSCSRTGLEDWAERSNITDLAEGGAGGSSAVNGGIEAGAGSTGAGNGGAPAEGGKGGITGGGNSGFAGSSGKAGESGNGGNGGNPELDGGVDASAGTGGTDAGTSGAGGNTINCNTVLVETSDPKENLVVPKGAMSVIGACWAVAPKTGCEISSIDQLQVHKYGSGLVSDLDALTLFFDVGNPTFPINPATKNIDFKIGSWTVDNSGMVCLIYDVASDAQTDDEHGFEIVSPSNIHGKSASGPTTSEGNFPLQGPNIRIGGAHVGIIQVTKQSEPSITLPANSSVKIDTSLTASTVEGFKLHKFGLAVQGSCDASTLTNIKLSHNDLVLAETKGAYPVIAPKQSIINFENTNLGTSLITVDEGLKKVFSLKADTKCPSGTNLTFCLDNKKRIHGEGTKFGFFNNIQNNFTCDPAHSVTVNFL